MGNEVLTTEQALGELQIEIAREYLLLTKIPGKGIYGVQRMAFTVGLFLNIDNTGYQGRYCYAEGGQAIRDLLLWDGQGDPPGDWIKFKSIGNQYTNPKFKTDFDDE